MRLVDEPNVVTDDKPTSTDSDLSVNGSDTPADYPDNSRLRLYASCLLYVDFVTRGGIVSQSAYTFALAADPAVHLSRRESISSWRRRISSQLRGTY